MAQGQAYTLVLNGDGVEELIRALLAFGQNREAELTAVRVSNSVGGDS